MDMVNHSHCSKCQKIAHISDLERCTQEDKLECLDKEGCLKRVLAQNSFNQMQQNSNEQIDTSN